MQRTHEYIITLLYCEYWSRLLSPVKSYYKRAVLLSRIIATITLRVAEVALDSKMNSHACNGIDKSLLTPQDILNQKSEQWRTPMTSEDFARKLDEDDPLRSIRDEFHFPKMSRLPEGIIY